MKGYLRKVGKVWYTTVELPRGPGNKRRQKQCRLGIMSKSDAQAKQREILVKIDLGQASDPSRLTVAEALDAWLTYLKPSPKVHNVPQRPSCAMQR